MRHPRDLADAIRELRGNRTQKELAEKAKIDPTTWSTYEKGGRFPRGEERLGRIADALGCPLPVLDEVMLKYRNQRLAKEASAAIEDELDLPVTDTASPEDGEKDAVRDFVEERMMNISHELVELIIFFRNEKRPST